MLPEIIILSTAGVMFLWDLVRGRDERGVVTIGFMGLFLALIWSVWVGAAPAPYFYGAFQVDRFTFLFRMVAPIVGIFVLMAGLADQQVGREWRSEFYALIVIAVAGIQLLAGATEFITIFVSLELVSITSFLLVGFLKGNPKSSEAALKFFLFGVTSTAALLYGLSLLYGYTGSTILSQVATILSHRGIQPVVFVSLILMAAGFGFKILMVPFHMWAPDVYEGAPLPITTFLAVGSKAAGFAVLLRVLITLFGGIASEWTPLFAVLAALTMTIGNVIALSQRNIKRLLAYSSIAHGGTMLVGLVALDSVHFGIPGLLYYLFGYLFATAGAFLVVIAVSRSLGSDEIEEYAGLSRRTPYLAAALTIFFLSLIGIPPLAGFVGKFLVFGAALERQWVWLAVVGVVNSVISVGYYFYVVKVMYLQDPRSPRTLILPRSLSWGIGIALFLTFLIGAYPDPFVALARGASAAILPPIY